MPSLPIQGSQLSRLALPRSPKERPRPGFVVKKPSLG